MTKMTLHLAALLICLSVGWGSALNAAQNVKIRVYIEHIEVTDYTLDPDDSGVDDGAIGDADRADFYACVEFGDGALPQCNDIESILEHYEDTNSIDPNWLFQAEVPADSSSAFHLKIAIMDDDTDDNPFVASQQIVDLPKEEADHDDRDDMVDINDLTGHRYLDLILSWPSPGCQGCGCEYFATNAGDLGTPSGVPNCGDEVTVKGNEDDQALVTFRVEVGAPACAPKADGGFLNIQCTHTCDPNPIWPQAGDTCTIKSRTMNIPPGQTGGTDYVAAQMEVWINPPGLKAASPAVADDYTNQLITTISGLSDGDHFSYGCLASLADGTAVWSGWHSVQVGLPLYGRAVPVLHTGPANSSLDIVFIPDVDRYFGDPKRPEFQTAVASAVDAYYREHEYNCRQDYINFWIALDGGTAHEGDDDHDPPDNWDDDYTFAEAGAIVHNLPTAEFRNSADIDERIFSASSSSFAIFRHEAGHTLFGLADEYCDVANPPRGTLCDGGYFETQSLPSQPDDPPYPNLYESFDHCNADHDNLDAFSKSYGFPASSAPVCTSGPSWPWVAADPASNDLMVDNKSCQPADARRFEWLITQCQASRCGGEQ